MSLLSNFANSLRTGVSQQMGQTTAYKPPVAPAPTTQPRTSQPAGLPVAQSKPVSASPAAVNPVIKSPAAQTYIQSQMKTAAPAAPAPTMPTAPTTPTAPTGYVDSPKSPGTTGNSAMDNYISAYKRYTDASANNSEVSEAKKYLNKLVLDDRMAREKALNSGETMGFAGGEEARVARNNSFAIDSATANLGVLQTDQTNQINSAKTGVDFAKDMITADAPIVVDGVAYHRAADGTLSPLTTKQLNPTEKYGTGAIGEYNFAKENGYKGTFSQYQNEDANRKRSIAAAGNSGLSTQEYTKLASITTKFQADPIINQAVRGTTASAIADQIIANPASATNQLKSLYVLVKNLDPDSAVREGELALANQTQSYMQQFGNTLARITEGRVVSPDAAVQLAQATKELMGAWNQTAQRRQQQYDSQANVLGVGDSFKQYVQGSNLDYNQPQTSTATNEFADIEPHISIEGKNAYIPRAVWSTLGNRMDALIAEARKDGYTLLVRD